MMPADADAVAAAHNHVAVWLAQPESYPHAAKAVQEIETHISRVFLAGPYAYKLKKPVRYDFLDFSTLALRERACREEVRLNRRLAPDTYLGVLPVVRDVGSGYRLGGDGQPVDWVVQMRQLPTDQTLDALHDRGELTPKHIDRLAERLNDFYRQQAPVEISFAEYRARIAAHVRGNLRELLAVGHQLPESVVRRVHGFQLQRLAIEPDLFDARVRTLRIVEGHGDLRPEHICFDEAVVIFDCVEFNPEFRELDIADELAFLAAECDDLGAEWVGRALLHRYQASSEDQIPPVLFDFYRSYRACVRAKVAALRADQLEGGQRERAASEARRRLDRADRYASPWQTPLMLAVGGLSGTGKTTLAAAVTEELGATLLRSDELRRELFGGGSHSAEIDRGIYSFEGRQRVYEEMIRRGAAVHRQQIAVVLDATFSTADAMEKAHRLATHPRSRFLAIECVCRPALASERIARRLVAGHDASESRPEIYEAQRARWEDWPATIPQLRLDTEQPVDQQVAAVLGALR